MPDFRSRVLKSRRPIDVYLPPVHVHQNERCALLVLNDGNEARDLGLERVLSDLNRQRAIDPLVVVAVHSGRDRFNEHGTAAARNAQGKGGPEAARYQRFLTDDVLPYVTSEFRCRTGAADHAIAGWSLGGLCAFDTAWNNPEEFGLSGSFSGSFWWRTDDRTNQTKQSSRLMHRIVRSSEKRVGLRFWFEAGTAEEPHDRDGNGVIDVIQDTTELMDELRALGYGDAEMRYVEVPGGRHHVQTWAAVFPAFLCWAFPRHAV